jgi:hypothetical protein
MSLSYCKEGMKLLDNAVRSFAKNRVSEVPLPSIRQKSMNLIASFTSISTAALNAMTRKQLLSKTYRDGTFKAPNNGWLERTAEQLSSNNQKSLK